MKLQALKMIYNRYRGGIEAGEVFDEPSQRNARVLIERGVARPYYETKVIVPEVKAPAVAEPFCDGLVPDPDPQPPALAAVVAAVCAVPDAPEQRNHRRGKRPGRKKSRSG